MSAAIPVTDLKGGDVLACGSEVFDTYAGGYGFTVVRLVTQNGVQSFRYRNDDLLFVRR